MPTVAEARSSYEQSAAGNSGRFSSAANPAGLRDSRDNLVDVDDDPKLEVARNLRDQAPAE